MNFFRRKSARKGMRVFIVGLFLFLPFQPQLLASLEGQKNWQIARYHPSPASELGIESFGSEKSLSGYSEPSSLVKPLGFRRRVERKQATLRKARGVYLQDLTSIENEWRRSLDIARST